MATRKAYEKVAYLIREEILSGRLSPGEQLPSERELADRFDVSRDTIRRGIALVAEMGILERIPGRGTFVAQRDSDSGKQVTLKLAQFNSGGKIVELFARRIIPAFEAKYPAISVVLTTEASPDIVVTDDAHIRHYINTGQIISLAPWMKQLDLDEYYPEAMEPVMMESTLWAFPRAFSPVMMFYNASLLKEHNIPLPEPDWKWEDFVVLAALATDLKEGYRGFAWTVNPKRWMAFVFQNAGAMLKDPYTSNMDAEEVVEAMGFYADLVHRYHIGTLPKDMTRFSANNELFLQGKSAFVANGAFSIVEYRNLGFQWGVVPLPQGKVRATCLAGEYMAISRHCPWPELAWEFIRFVAGREVQGLLAEVGYGLPPSRAVIKQLSSEHRLFLEELPFARLAWEGRTIEPWLLAINESWRAWSGKEEVRTVCERIKQAQDVLLRKNLLTQGEERPECIL